MNQKKDFYKILGVNKDSTKEEIKKAYRSKAMEFHPDKNPNNKEAEEKFKEIAEAYETLSNEEKKKAYDNPNTSFYDLFNSGNRVYDFDAFSKGFGGSGFYDVGDLLYGNKRQNRQQIKIKGSNLKITIQLTLEEVLSGVEKTIKIHRDTLCTSCNGSCCEPNTKTIACNICGGKGVIEEHESMDGSIYNVRITSRHCDHCNGTGRIPEKPCKKCSGQGTTKEPFQFNVNIHKGVQDDVLLYRGYGNISKDNIPGDLYVQLIYLSNERFKREGADIQYNLRIGLLDVVFGTKILIPTLHGDVTLKLTKGIKNGKLLKLSGKGLPHPNTNTFGNQYVNIILEIPENFTTEEQEIMSKLTGSNWITGTIEN